MARGKATEVQATADGVRLASHDGNYASSGEYLSEVREAGFPFTSAVLSWRADAPEGTLVRFELRVRGSGDWSRWYAMGEWRKEGGRSVSGQADGNGRVNVDTLALSAPATALQYRPLFSTSAPA